MRRIARLAVVLALFPSSGCFACYWNGKLLEPGFPSQVATIDTWTLTARRLQIRVTVRTASGRVETHTLESDAPSSEIDSVAVSPPTGPTVLPRGCGMDEIAYTPPITRLDDPVVPFRVSAHDARTGIDHSLASVPLVAEVEARNIVGWILLPFSVLTDSALFPLELLIWGLSWSWR